MKIYYSELFKNIIFIKNYYKYFFRLIREKISYLLAGLNVKTDVATTGKTRYSMTSRDVNGSRAKMFS